MNRYVLAGALAVVACGAEVPREPPVERPTAVPLVVPPPDSARDTAAVRGDTIMLRDTATG